MIPFRLCGLTPVDGGGKEIPWKPEPIRDLRVVPEAGGTLWLLTHRSPVIAAERAMPFTAAEVVRRTRDGLTTAPLQGRT